MDLSESLYVQTCPRDHEGSLRKKGMKGVMDVVGSQSSAHQITNSSPEQLANFYVPLSSRIVNLVVAVLMILGGVSQFFPLGMYVPISYDR